MCHLVVDPLPTRKQNIQLKIQILLIKIFDNWHQVLQRVYIINDINSAYLKQRKLIKFHHQRIIVFMQMTQVLLWIHGFLGKTNETLASNLQKFERKL